MISAADLESLADTLEDTARTLSREAHELRRRAQRQRNAVRCAELALQAAREPGVTTYQATKAERGDK